LATTCRRKHRGPSPRPSSTPTASDRPPLTGLELPPGGPFRRSAGRARSR
jgi:hypothetical protein